MTPVAGRSSAPAPRAGALAPHYAVLALALFVAGGLAVARPAAADSLDSTCVTYPAGSDHANDMVACVFSQRQGFVSIDLEGGPRHELSPVGDEPGNYTDATGQAVYRQADLGDQGLIFRFPGETIYVYWGRSRLDRDATDNPTAPFSTADYDATTLLPCARVDGSERGSCPAGILRMDGGQASIVVQDLDGARFTINFLGEVVNATNRTAEARFDGVDTWTVVIDGATIFTVPLAAIEGG